MQYIKSQQLCHPLIIGGSQDLELCYDVVIERNEDTNMLIDSRKLYVITGKLANGRRFRPIKTNQPQNYNIYQGTIWEVQPNGKRKRIATVWN